MKRVLLLTFVLFPIIAGCNHFSSGNSIENSDFKTDENIKTRDYKNIKADEIHLTVDDGYIPISSILIDSFYSIAVEEEITYLYKLSCKNSNDSFSIRKITCDDDGFYYAEISDNQHSMIPNGFNVLKNSNPSGSSVEISIMNIYQCYSYIELYYSETEQKIKVVNFDHVIPGLEESMVNSLLGKSVDHYVYVDEAGIKSLNHGNLPFSSELLIEYIDVSDRDIQIKEYL